ncbi:MAG: hemolysin III family protein [Pedosphaera sp.]|nr:hemolysin III family protein [Pedosphaera sp.]
MLAIASLHGSTRAVVGALLFGTTLMALYTASTVYDVLHPGPGKRLARVVDHSAIYLLIAGTYTHFCLVTLKGPWGWSLFGLVWGLAAVGLAMKISIGFRLPKASLVLYLVMGWLALIATVPLLQRLPIPGLIWLAAGGLCYTSGVLFFVRGHLPFRHTAWHLMVLSGSLCHVVSITGWALR